MKRFIIIITATLLFCSVANAQMRVNYWQCNTLEVDGTSTFENTITLDDSSGDSPGLVLTDGSDTTLTITKTDDGFATATASAATQGLQVLVGNLKIGNGTPGVTLNGEDFYCEGTSEFDNSLRVDSNVDINAADASNYALDVINSATGGGLKVTSSGTGNVITALDGSTTMFQIADGAAGPTFRLDSKSMTLILDQYSADPNADSATHTISGIDTDDYILATQNTEPSNDAYLKDVVASGTDEVTLYWSADPGESVKVTIMIFAD